MEGIVNVVADDTVLADRGGVEAVKASVERGWEVFLLARPRTCAYGSWASLSGEQVVLRDNRTFKECL